jgi:large subunit ribosomal protein L24
MREIQSGFRLRQIAEEGSSMAGIKIKRNDTVEVIAGKDKGKRGRVLRIIADKNRLLVEHVMMIKKHVKPNPQRNIKGGIAEQESSIHVSNVMLVDGEGNKTRVGTRMEGDNKVRFSKVSGNAIPEKKSKKS